ncbi:MAG: HipA domain-containing protein, partial [Bradymonadaceae bacterium]
SSYEELARTLKRFCGAYAVESEKLFRIIVFNYGFANGDAHLKNFSLLRTSLGDYILSPAYDLLSTQLHLPHETRLALDLFADEEYSEGELSHGFVTGKDLLELGRRMGLIEHRAAAVLRDFLWHHTEVEALIDRSFLSPEAKAVYHAIIADRRRALILDVPPATLDTTTP